MTSIKKKIPPEATCIIAETKRLLRIRLQASSALRQERLEVHSVITGKTHKIYLQSEGVHGTQELVSISPWQIALIILLLLLLFGPKRLPGLGKSIGEALRSFKKGLDNKEDPKSENIASKDSED